MKKVIVILGFCLLCTSVSMGAEYKVGIVPQFNLGKLKSIWNPILAEISKKTGHQLTLVPKRNIRSFGKSLEAGEFDFAYMNPFHAVVTKKTPGYRPLVRDTSRGLQGIVVVAQDSPIQSIQDLEGKSIAFPAPNALGASLLIRAELGNKNIQIRPKYVGTHKSGYLQVTLGKAQAAGGVKRTLNAEKSLMGKLRILHTTPSVAPHPFSVHQRVPEADAIAIQNAFLEMKNAPHIQKFLEQVPFGSLGKASANDYLPLEKMGLADYYVKD